MVTFLQKQSPKSQKQPATIHLISSVPSGNCCNIKNGACYFIKYIIFKTRLS